MESTSNMRVSLAKHTLPVQGYSILPLIKKITRNLSPCFKSVIFLPEARKQRLDSTFIKRFVARVVDDVSNVAA